MTTPAVSRIVLKFGGSSVSTAHGWDTIAQIVQTTVETGDRVLVIHSALSGITDGLDLLPEEAIAGRHSTLLEGLSERHYALARDLGLDGSSILAKELVELGGAAEGIRSDR